MSNQEITNVQALQELYEFGGKCYKKGYRRAAIDMYAGIGLVVASMFCMGLIDKIGTRKDRAKR